MAALSDLSNLEAEEKEGILFDSLDDSFRLQEQAKLSTWIAAIVTKENCTIHTLQYVFCNDDYLHELNVAYLDHDTLTDVITFPYALPPEVHGDVFISLERVRENASDLNTSFEEELHRVIIHGALHLCGYQDKADADITLMRNKEDEALQMLHEMA
jgi:rRNA maturation RNase YbeY